MVMGLCYYYGLGIEQDIQQAVHWFTLGAEGGHADCMRELAKLYRYGVLVPKDSAKALSYMRQAIRGGNESAGVMLAWCYLIGDGVEQDFARAYQLFLRAARNGDGEACYWVGICHHMGYGVPVDNTAAYQWYGVGAWHGCLNCMTALGRSYARAEGTRRDLSQSRYWLQRAQSQGVYAAEIIHRDLELAQAVTTTCAGPFAPRAIEMLPAPSFAISSGMASGERRSGPRSKSVFQDSPLVFMPPMPLPMIVATRSMSGLFSSV
jgi:TPR repeat protein